MTTLYRVLVTFGNHKALLPYVSRIEKYDDAVTHRASARRKGYRDARIEAFVVSDDWEVPHG